MKKISKIQQKQEVKVSNPQQNNQVKVQAQVQEKQVIKSKQPVRQTQNVTNLQAVTSIQNTKPVIVAIQQQQQPPIIRKQIQLQQVNTVNQQKNQNISPPVIIRNQIQLQQVNTVNQQKNQNQSNLVFNDDEYVNFQAQNTQQQVKEIDFTKQLEISIRARFNQIQLSKNEDFILPVMVSLKTKENEQENEQTQTQSRAPIDLICVIDHSGSMQGEKIKLVRETLLQLLEILGQDDRLCLIQFDDKADKLTPLLRVTPQNLATFQNQIGQLKDNGGTDIAKGMDFALQVIANRKYKNPVTSIFLLSDGQDSSAKQKVPALVKQFQQSIQESYTIMSFGFGQDHDPQLMSDISKIKDGSFFFIEKLSQVDESFVAALGELLSVLYQEISLQVDIQDQILKTRISKVFGESWKTIEDQKKYMVNLSQMIQGTSKDFIIEITIPKSDLKFTDESRNFLILKSNVRAQCLNEKKQIIEKQQQLVVQLFNAEEEKLNEIDEDGEVMENYFRVKAAEALQICMQQAEQGNLKEGEEILEKMTFEINQNTKVKKEKMVHLLSDLQNAKDLCKPQIYQQKGKHAMINMKRAHYEQKAMMLNEDDNEENWQYQNKVQKCMTKMCKDKKK